MTVLGVVRRLMRSKPQWPQGVLVERHVELHGCLLFGPAWIGFRTYANDSMIRHNTTIGRYCSIGRRVTIGAAQHSLTRLTTHGPAFDVAGGINPAQEPARNTVGNDVWIGDNVVILSGLSIGDGAVIGAGAVVTRDVAPYAIVAGVPARPLRMRFDAETVEALLDLRWWDYGDEILQGVNFDDVRTAISQMQRKDTQPLAPHHAQLGSA